MKFTFAAISFGIEDYSNGIITFECSIAGRTSMEKQHVLTVSDGH